MATVGGSLIQGLKPVLGWEARGGIGCGSARDPGSWNGDCAFQTH